MRSFGRLLDDWEQPDIDSHPSFSRKQASRRIDRGLGGSPGLPLAGDGHGPDLMEFGIDSSSLLNWRDRHSSRQYGGRDISRGAIVGRWHDITCHLAVQVGIPTSQISEREPDMSEPQLSVRSAKARDLAHRLARREHRSVADVVERALEAYEIREAGREPASVFYARLANDYGSDIDLEALIREGRQIDPGPEL